MSSQPAADQANARFTLTRADVAARLGVSVSSVRRMEFDSLHPVQDGQGVWRFDPAALEGIAALDKRERRGVSPQLTERRREGKLAAQTFTLFARGASLRQIVIKTKQTPERIRALY